MKIIAKWFPMLEPPLLQLWIHDAPHRRMNGMRQVRALRREQSRYAVVV